MNKCDRRDGGPPLNQAKITTIGYETNQKNCYDRSKVKELREPSRRCTCTHLQFKNIFNLFE